MWDPLIAGFFTGGALIVAIGAQNAFVLRQGLARDHVGAVVAVCAVSDAVLIAAGVGGVGTVVAHADWVVEVVTWLGVAFLLWYATGSLRRAFHPGALQMTGAAPAAATRSKVVGRAVSLTWLNPHVYLDTVLLLGSVAATHSSGSGGAIDGRWVFAVGATAASVAWFSGLGFGAHRLAPLLSRPRSWQLLELAIAATMVFVAARLAFG